MKIVKWIISIALLVVSIGMIIWNFIGDFEKWQSLILNIISVLGAAGFSFSITYNVDYSKKTKITNKQTGGDGATQYQSGGEMHVEK